MRAMELLRIATQTIEKHGANAPVYVPTIIDESTVRRFGNCGGADPETVRIAIARISSDDDIRAISATIDTLARIEKECSSLATQ